jgi:thiamine biosynthesis lipoprotein
MSTFALRASLIVLALLGTAGAPALSRFEFTAVHMGVPVRITLYAASASAATAAGRAAFARIAALDATMSDYRPDSELVQLSATPGEWVQVSEDLFAVLARAREIADATGGAFDPTLGRLTSLWRDARRSGRRPDATAQAEARAATGWRRLDLDRQRRAVRLAAPGLRLDLGGIAKGYILNQARRALAASGHDRALIEAGGDIVAGAAPPGAMGWRVHVPGASAPFQALAGALRHAALATSGATSQFVEIDGVRYSHVLDPATGVGVTHASLAHVIADDGATADALATALSVVGPARAGGLMAAFPGVWWSFAPKSTP